MALDWSKARPAPTPANEAAAEARRAARRDLDAYWDVIRDKLVLGTPLTAAERNEWGRLKAAAKKP